MTYSTPKSIKVGIPAALLITLGIWGGATAASQPSDAPSFKQPAPSAPPWVRSDGSIAKSKVPAQIGVLGADGLPLLDEKGNPVTVSSDELFGPPPLSPSSTGRAPDSADRHVVTHEDGSVEEIIEDVDHEYEVKN